MCAEDACDDLLVGDQKHTFGALCFNGSCQMMDEYAGTAGSDMFLTWHVFGDPSLLARTKTPQAMLVQHDGTILIGQTSYEVRVVGVPGALCALYGDGILYGSVVTDALGTAMILLDPLPTMPMTLSLTVSAYNKIPTIEPVEVLPPSGPYVTYEGSAVADVDEGDGDGLCEAGETVLMTIRLKNVGIAPATGVTAVLTGNDPYVEIQDGTQSYGDIPAGEIVQSGAPYRIVIAPGTPDNHVVDLDLAIHANEGDWNRGFPMVVTAPILGYATHAVDDAPPWGNGTGWVAPGEVIRISLTLRNTGHANAVHPVATLIPGDPMIQILSGTAECAGIPAGAQEMLTPFEVLVSPACPSPSVLTLSASVVDDFGLSGSIDFQVAVGGFVDDCELNRGWTLGASNDTATTGLWVLADPNGTTYNGSVVQPEDDHTAAPGVSCFVTGNGSVGGTAGEADLDGGRTTLTSPTFDLHAVSGATVSYWVWYTNDLGNNPGQDTWAVQITSDGTNWVDLERTLSSTNAFVERSFAIETFVPLTDQVQVRFIADDQAPNSLIEALVDDFMITVQEPTVDAPEVPARLEYALDPLLPNPARAGAVIRFTMPRDESASVSIYDVAGRLIRNVAEGPQSAGTHRVHWDRRNLSGHPVVSGVYFVRMKAPGFTQVRTVTLLD